MTLYRMPAEVLRAKVEGDEVLLNPETGIYHLVNPIGRIVIEALDEAAEPDRAVVELVRRFGVDQDQAERDVEAFVRALLERKLLEEIPG